MRVLIRGVGDPRGDPAVVRGIGERPARIADGVLHAIDAALGQP